MSDTFKVKFVTPTRIVAAYPFNHVPDIREGQAISLDDQHHIEVDNIIVPTGPGAITVRCHMIADPTDAITICELQTNEINDAEEIGDADPA